MGGINDNVVKIVTSEFEISRYSFFGRVHLILVLILFPAMSTDKMKGLLKGLRYISNIFGDAEAEDKEPEMQIGFPTDVKRMAHVGWDDYSMNELKSESVDQHTDTTIGKRNGAGISPKSHSQDAQHNGEVHTSSARDLPTVPLPKSSKCNPSSSSANQTSHQNKHSRQHQSSYTNSSDRDKSESSRRGRREHNITTRGDITQYETSSALQDQLAVAPKQARRRKVKGSSSSSGTSSRTSRSKEKQLLKPMREEEEEKEEGR